MEIAHRLIGGTMGQDFCPVGTAECIGVSSRPYWNKEFTKIWECTLERVSNIYRDAQQCVSTRVVNKACRKLNV